MVNVDEINGIIESLKKDADNIHEISLLCTKIAEVGDGVEDQQQKAVENLEKLKELSSSLSSVQEKYKAALEKLSVATDLLETTASDFKVEMKRFENENNERLESYRSKTLEQLKAYESDINRSLNGLDQKNAEHAKGVKDDLNASLGQVYSEVKMVKIFSIVAACCSLATVIAALAGLFA